MTNSEWFTLNYHGLLNVNLKSYHPAALPCWSTEAGLSLMIITWMGDLLENTVIVAKKRVIWHVGVLLCNPGMAS